MPWFRWPSRSWARAATSRTSFTVAVTAESCSNALAVVRAMSWAMVVLPVPGGPQRITDDSRSAWISARSGRPGPSRCSWPTTSSSDVGRRRAASGAWRTRRSSAAAAKRSSGIGRGYRCGCIGRGPPCATMRSCGTSSWCSSGSGCSWRWVSTPIAIYRRATQGPKAQRQSARGLPSPASERRRCSGGSARAHRLPSRTAPSNPGSPGRCRTCRHRPRPTRAPTPRRAPMPVRPQPTARRAPTAAPVRATVTLAEALEGITMPADLLPIVEPGEPGLIDGRRARFGATGTNDAPSVAAAVADGAAATRLSRSTASTRSRSTRAGLTATRDGHLGGRDASASTTTPARWSVELKL